MKRLPLSMRVLAAGLLGVSALLPAGCVTRPPPKPPSYAVLLDNPDGTTGAITITSSSGQVLITRSRFGATLDGSSQPSLFDQTRLDADFGEVLAARPALPITFVLYFEGTSTTLTEESKKLIGKVLAAIANRPVPDITITGHTDTLSSVPWNDRLGLERALLIAKIIADAKLNVVEVTVISSGESDLAVKTPDETAEPRNRRVEISIR